MTSQSRIRGNTVLPARREALTLHTSDGLALVGEVALPLEHRPIATLVCLHPLPTHGGMMDSHLFRKAAWRLPALADLAVLRFNSRGTSSLQGTSEGEFDAGEGEQYDLAAALEYAEYHDLPQVWLLAWSFGSDLALRYGLDPVVVGRSCSPRHCGRAPTTISTHGPPTAVLVALVPEFDDYVRPLQARTLRLRCPRRRSSRSRVPSTCGWATPSACSTRWWPGSHPVGPRCRRPGRAGRDGGHQCVRRPDGRRLRRRPHAAGALGRADGSGLRGRRCRQTCRAAPRLPLAGAMFAAQVAGLADQARVVVPDLRGFGGSPGPARASRRSAPWPTTSSRCSAASTSAPPSCLAWSMGGYVAMAMLRRHPLQVGAVVLIDTKAGADDGPARGTGNGSRPFSTAAPASCGRCSTACSGKPRGPSGPRWSGP